MVRNFFRHLFGKMDHETAVTKQVFITPRIMTTTIPYSNIEIETWRIIENEYASAENPDKYKIQRAYADHYMHSKQQWIERHKVVWINYIALPHPSVHYYYEGAPMLVRDSPVDMSQYETRITYEHNAEKKALLEAEQSIARRGYGIPINTPQQAQQLIDAYCLWEEEQDRQTLRRQIQQAEEKRQREARAIYIRRR